MVYFILNSLIYSHDNFIHFAVGLFSNLNKNKFRLFNENYSIVMFNS